MKAKLKALIVSFILSGGLFHLSAATANQLKFDKPDLVLKAGVNQDSYDMLRLLKKGN